MAEQRFKPKVDLVMIAICLGPMAALAMARVAGLSIGDVSPADRAGFVRAIRDRAPQVRLDESLAKPVT